MSDDPGAAQTADAVAPQNPRRALLGGLVALVGIAAFAGAIAGPWILDDHDLIQLNPYIHSFHYWRHWLISEMWDVGPDAGAAPRTHYYRPLATASYALDWAIGHGSPVVFHVTNLVWEAAAGLLAFFTLERWLKNAWLPALLAALVFVVHPTKAESVAWIAGRTDVICAVWLFVASLGVARRLRGQRGGLALEIGGTLLAYLTKETAIVLPAFVVLETWVALDRPAIDRSFVLRALKSALPQLGVALTYLALRQILLPVSTVPTHSALSTTGDHLQLVLETLGRAAELSVFPRHLMIQQGLVRVDVTTGKTVHSAGYVALGAAMLVTIGVGAWLARRRAPGITLGLSFFLVTFAPTANLVPTHLYTIISERFLYLPMLGLAQVVGELVLHAAKRRRAVIAGSSLVIAIFAALSFRRGLDYSSGARFWKHEAAVNHWSYSALLHLAYLDIDHHQYDAALGKLTRAHALAHRWFPDSGSEISLMMEAIEVLVHVTPDAQAKKLEKLDRFVTGVLQPGQKTIGLDLQKPTLRAELSLDNPIVQRLVKSLRPRLLITHADIQSRIGDPKAGAQAAEQAWQACRRCSATAQTAAVILARDGRYADARRVLANIAALQEASHSQATRARIERAYRWHLRAAAPGPVGILARARELSTLGAYGRAFALLSPHEDAIRNVPTMLMGYAELAWRAGHPDVARRVLAKRVDARELQRLTKRWSQRMGWVPSRRYQRAR